MAANTSSDWQQPADPLADGLHTVDITGGTAAWRLAELVYEPAEAAMVVDLNHSQVEALYALNPYKTRDNPADQRAKRFPVSRSASH